MKTDVLLLFGLAAAQHGHQQAHKHSQPQRQGIIFRGQGGDTPEEALNPHGHNLTTHGYDITTSGTGVKICSQADWSGNCAYIAQILPHEASPTRRDDDGTWIADTCYAIENQHWQGNVVSIALDKPLNCIYYQAEACSEENGFMPADPLAMPNMQTSNDGHGNYWENMVSMSCTYTFNAQYNFEKLSNITKAGKAKQFIHKTIVLGGIV